MYPSWLEIISAKAGAPVTTISGQWVIANTQGEQDAATLRAIANAAANSNARVETVDPVEIPGLQPEAGCQAASALYLPDEATIDTHVLLSALHQALEKSPLASVFSDRATELSSGSTGVVIQTQGGTSIHGSEVVLAGGASSLEIIDPEQISDLGLPPIFSGRGASILLRTPFSLPRGIRTPNRTFACGLHLIPRENGTVYLGATNRLSTSPDFDRGPAVSEVQNLLDGATRQLHSSLRDAEIIQINVGHRPVVADHIPLVGRTGDPRILIATGTYRNGILLAPLVAKIIAEELTNPGIHASHPFSPAREMPSGIPHDREWLLTAARSLVTTLTEPEGRLSRGRDGDLEKFFATVLGGVLDPAEGRRVRLRLERLLERAPMAEVVPLAFEAIVRHVPRSES